MTAQRVRTLLFDFHETLITADRWMAMETGGIATEILTALGLYDGKVPDTVRRRATDVHMELRSISKETGIEHSAEAVTRAVLRAIGGERRLEAPAVADAVERVYRSCLSDVALKAGVSETLHSLAQMGYRMGVVSNAAYAPFLDWALDAQGVRAVFEVIVVSAEVGLRKPRREIFDAALDALDVSAAGAVYIGNDYLKDVVGAKLAGLGAVWIPDRMSRDLSSLVPVFPDAVTERFDALPAVINDLNAGRLAG